MIEIHKESGIQAPAGMTALVGMTGSGKSITMVAIAKAILLREQAEADPGVAAMDFEVVGVAREGVGISDWLSDQESDELGLAEPSS